jgi:predicted nuclease of restriction endonuclease-like RecB superfamily
VVLLKKLISLANKSTRNKFEKKIERQLKKAKVSFKYESERIPYVIAGHYIPDFVLVTPRGKILIETKGYFRPEAKRKMVAVKKLNPQLDIRLVFYTRKASDIKWATKHGFLYGIEDIPEEWLT